MKKYIITSLVGLLSLTSCSLDDNINPNKPQASSISPRKRLAAAQTTTYVVQAGRMNALGNIWMNSWSGNIYQYGNPATDETSLTLHSGFYAGVWSDTYRAVTRLEQIITSPEAANLPNHVAIAKILKAYYMQYIVDLYGDVPYSEAFKEQSLVTPKYDNDSEVYQALAKELYDAIALIDATTVVPDNAVNATEDVIMGGKMADWKSFANTVLLKMAVRLSKTTDASGVALRNEIINKISGKTFVSKDITINPGYSSATAEAQNPLYNWFGRQTAAGASNTGGYLLYRASDHMVKSLEGHSSKITSGVSDPRIGYIFAATKEYCTGKTIYNGLVQGAPKLADNCADKTKYTNNNFSGFGGIFSGTAAVGSATNGVIMPLSESELLQAEAAVVYPAKFSGGQAHFEKAINASFAFDGMASSAPAYITAITGKNLVGWGATPNDQIAAIQYQKWVALANYNGIETFINYRRTGYPQTPLAVSAVKPNKPYRLVYPSSEYTSNAANVPKMTGDDCFTINDFTPFWYK